MKHSFSWFRDMILEANIDKKLEKRINIEKGDFMKMSVSLKRNTHFHRFGTWFWKPKSINQIEKHIKIEKRWFYQNERFAYTKHSSSWFQEMILEATIDKKTWKTYGKTKTIRKTAYIYLYSHFTLQKHVLKPWKWVFRVGQTLIFIKSPFSFFGPILMICDWFCIDFGWFVDRFCIDVGWFFDWFGVMAGHEFCTIKLQGCCCWCKGRTWILHHKVPGLLLLV